MKKSYKYVGAKKAIRFGDVLIRKGEKYETEDARLITKLEARKDIEEVKEVKEVKRKEKSLPEEKDAE